MVTTWTNLFLDRLYTVLYNPFFKSLPHTLCIDLSTFNHFRGVTEITSLAVDVKKISADDDDANAENILTFSCHGVHIVGTPKFPPYVSVAGFSGTFHSMYENNYMSSLEPLPPLPHIFSEYSRSKNFVKSILSFIQKFKTISVPKNFQITKDLRKMFVI